MTSSSLNLTLTLCFHGTSHPQSISVNKSVCSDRLKIKYLTSHMRNKKHKLCRAFIPTKVQLVLTRSPPSKKWFESDHPFIQNLLSSQYSCSLGTPYYLKMESNVSITMTHAMFTGMLKLKYNEKKVSEKELDLHHVSCSNQAENYVTSCT